ncbi:MAG: signal peptidase I [Vicinamibacteria bacterium]
MSLDPNGPAPAEPSPGGAAVAEVGGELALPHVPPEVAGPPAEHAGSRVWRATWEFLHDLSVAVLFCFFLITFVAQAFRVQGTSMEPLLEDGERIVVNKFVYRFRAIDRGDVVVFWYPRDPSVSFIKRVVGLPGDTVEIRGGRLIVNGAAVDERYLPPAFRDSDSLPPTEVRRGYYFVLGDHRRSSNDSRSWGEVPERYIYGRAVFRFWPLARVGPIH